MFVIIIELKKVFYLNYYFIIIILSSMQIRVNWEVKLNVVISCSFSSVRTPGPGQAKRRTNHPEEEEDDLMKDMEDPAPVPSITEVTIPRPASSVKSQRDIEQLPIKGGIMTDLEEEIEVKLLILNFKNIIVRNL